MEIRKEERGKRVRSVVHGNGRGSVVRRAAVVGRIYALGALLRHGEVVIFPFQAGKMGQKAVE